MEALGPTYVKMGQMMSIRPDVIPQPAMLELQKLQDGVATFDNQLARAVAEEELGRPLDHVFSEFSDEPIASASLAQVYRARLRDSGVEVAVKIQRPDALTICSKDMYVLQRAVDVYQRIMQRWTAQRVDYNALLEAFASGFYQELDFEQEAHNQHAARKAVLEAMGGRVYVPKVFFEFCSRRLLVTEFVYGSKLTECEPAELRRLTAVGQECFLKQLLEPGQFLHADPHGGTCGRYHQMAENACPLHVYLGLHRGFCSSTNNL
jgi:aarF domain-containing kinase